MKLHKAQQDEINSLTLHMILYATIGTLCAAFIALGLRLMQLATISPELQFIPWALALVFGVSIAYKRGVQSVHKLKDGE